MGVMKTILNWLGLLPKPFSVYRIAEGTEECRIRREILQGIRNRCKQAARREIGGGS